MLLLGWSRGLGVAHTTLRAACIFTMAPSRENLRKCMPQLSEARALHFKGQMVFCLQEMCNSFVQRIKAELTTRQGSYAPEGPDARRGSILFA